MTNPIINNQVEDRYWNTKLRTGQQWNGSDARINTEAQYPDGRYTVWVSAYDIEGKGGDMTTRQGAEDEEVLIDNFKPYLKKMEIYQDGGQRYSDEGEWDETNEILKRKHTEQKDRQTGVIKSGKEISVKLEFSEPVKGIMAGLNFPSINMTAVAGSNDKVWEGSFCTDRFQQVILCGSIQH